MDTISECRYRWLRVPATKLMKNPCNLKGLQGFRFGTGIHRNKINNLAFRFKSPRNHTQSYQGEKSSRRYETFAASIFHRIRSAKCSSGTVLLFAMFESKPDVEPS
jgi:hypothetical protein